MISLEVMLLNINLLLVLSSLYLDDFWGQVLVLFIFATAAAEASVGLALFILYYRFLGLLSVDLMAVVKG
jgi:NADH-quinone oxidoreductase subunit K